MQRALFTSIFLILFSCNNADTSTKDSGAKESAPVTLSVTQRHELVNELKKLKAILASKDKNEIVFFFQFPLIPQEGNGYLSDSILAENKGEITKQAFLQNFDEIYGNLSLEPLLYCISQLKLDSLGLKNEIVDDLPINNNKPCYSTYQMSLSHDTLNVQTSSDSNSDFVPKKGEESEFDGCESQFVWQFRFDGQKLIFIKHFGAG